ncbi:DoxX family membrane protein [Peterkaempfera bronchialis]|uniref:DoxX family membrane protein n=2 Tax=Peterkaempfera bronchialis TaxID=2126346 RepID=A0A345T5F1_9ACTN|nr:DoxX family membrane protein [Peterkaempfera bronchialis]
MPAEDSGPRPAPAAPALRRALEGPAAAWASTVARLGLAAVWAWAGLAKIADPAEAAQAVRAYRILPESLVKPVGYGLPFLELALALLLLVGLGTRVAAFLSGVLLLVFIAGIASVWARGLTIDCGCFGGGGQVASSQTRYLQEILRDTGFLLLAGWLIRKPRSRFSADGWLAA